MMQQILDICSDSTLHIFTNMKYLHRILILSYTFD